MGTVIVTAKRRDPAALGRGRARAVMRPADGERTPGGTNAVDRSLRQLMLRLVALPRGMRKTLVVALDLVACTVAVWIGYWLRLVQWELSSRRVLIFIGIAVATWPRSQARRGLSLGHPLPPVDTRPLR